MSNKARENNAALEEVRGWSRERRGKKKKKKRRISGWWSKKKNREGDRQKLMYTLRCVDC